MTGGGTSSFNIVTRRAWDWHEAVNSVSLELWVEAAKLLV